MKYGLIGYPLVHSFSVELHKKFDNYDYILKQLDNNQINQFLETKNFLGINITIPYKQLVVKYLDYIDDSAKQINTVNTIKNVNNKLFGYNTDILGFLFLLKKNNIVIKDKNVLILGTGATSNTVQYVISNLNPKSIHKIYCKGGLDNNLDFDLNNTEVIVNTTPNGMSPHTDDKLLFDFNDFKNIKYYIDVIYNPLRNDTILEAESNNILAVNGLYMLVAQGYFANLIFKNDNVNFDNIYTDDFYREHINKIDIVYKKILNEKQNIVLIGMPSCGKTTIAKMLSKKMNKKYIDIDEEIEKIIKTDISNFILKNGESEFRQIEKKVISQISLYNNIIISTGGGSIIDEINVKNLKHNGKLYFINRSLEKLKPTKSRPLTSNVELLNKKYNERMPIYKRISDKEIDGDLELEEKIEKILNDYYFNN